MRETYEEWHRQNARRLHDSQADTRVLGHERTDVPDLSRREHAADNLRCADGKIHPWWAYTDPAIRQRWLDELDRPA